MRRYWIFCAVCLCATFLVMPWVSASSALRVNSVKTKASLLTDKIEIALAIENASSKSISAQIKLELLDTKNAVRALSERQENIASGLHIAPFEMSLKDLYKSADEALLWCRLRYSFKTGGTVQTGIITLAEITSDMFEIRVVTPLAAFSGNRYKSRVIAVQPVTLEPISGVKVTGEIKLGREDKGDLKASGITDDTGYALLDFQLPENLGDDFLNLKVTGEYKGLTQQTDGQIQSLYQEQYIINSDKLIYQPGQTLHVRAILLNLQRHVLTGRETTLKITDEENQVVYRTTLKTSQFGIASADWNIPANIRLGEYTIAFNTEDQNDTWYSRHLVKISRYELPNFTVQTKLDRAYYLPNQQPEVEVRGEYLFGQPVIRGRVKVVRETERHWNFREQKWEIEEEDKQEGELNREGRFVAKLNLSDAREDLEESDYQQFKDVSFTAYITDLTTNRTEQRRFDVRLTKEPIHVYLIASHAQSNELPMEFYISTFYADGTPARCQVQVYKITKAEGKKQYYGQPLRIVKTNRYGLAKVENLLIKDLIENHYWESLKLIATDNKGMSGQCDENVYFREDDEIYIKTDKAIYRTGEPITIQIAASKEASTVFVEVSEITAWQSLFFQKINLINGQATITIPYQKNFKGEIVVSAYTNSKDEDSGDQCPSHSRGIIYPQNDELKLNVIMSQNQYRPGEQASANISVKAQNSGVESALGITVFDKAVDERRRTDSESNSNRNYLDTYTRQFDNQEQLAGINRHTLNQLDLSKPVPEDLQLLTEILLRTLGTIWQNYTSESYTTEFQEAFKKIMTAQFFPVVHALGVRYRRTAGYPTNGAQLRRELNDFGLDFDALRDPWYMPYRERFFISRDERKLQFISAGIDKKFGTRDDFIIASMGWNYFKPIGEIVDRALKNHHQHTGQYIKDLNTLRAELRREGVDLATLRDPWGSLYHVEFGILRTKYSVTFTSSGADKNFKNRTDNFNVWTSLIDYTTEMQAKLGEALNAYHVKTKNFPQNDDEFAEALKQQNIDRNSLRDGWNKSLYAVYKSESRYADRVRLYSYAQFPEQSKQRTEIIPVTQQIRSVTIRSIGADGKEGTFDDFDVAQFSRVVTEQSRLEEKPQLKKIALREPSVLPDGTGEITGIVSDSANAFISGVRITATNKASEIEYQTTTDDAGRYSIRNLPSGVYDLKFEAPGFMNAVISDISVTSNNVIGVNISLRVGATSETVTVTAAAESVQTESASVSSVASREIQNLRVQGRSLVQTAARSGISAGGEIATPRLREYFPETLFWQPEIITDANGRAQVKFKLADNITTWKFSAIASTTDGRIAVAEREVRAFQPFFVELDPPRILTTGDRLALPVVLRNYLDKPQSIKLQLNGESWFEMIGAAQKQTNIAAGDARRETFDIRATSAIQDGKQRVTAIGSEASDAIEKTVSVHPDGEEITQTANQIFSENGKLEINIPVDAIKNSTSAQLKIYPNLMAHVFESIEAIMQRPYGCAEQTISSAYPSLLALRYCSQIREESSPVCLKARRYMQAGYERLLNYRGIDGGFSYWGRGDSDFALTAYALKFLTEASELIEVEEPVIDSARDWLIKYQQSDGRWVAQNWQKIEDKRRSALLTAYVAQIFAARIKKATSVEVKQDANNRQKLINATKRALDYLSPRIDEIDEPYMMATYALAAHDAGEQAKAEHAIERLRLFARDENGAGYWSLETNTPFYGWGLAGRIETTAFAVRALAASSNQKEDANNHQDKDIELINRGLLFLMRQKDRFGVWHSTQATVIVLDALTTVLSQRDVDGRKSDNQKAAGNQAEIIVNGKPTDLVTLPPSSQLTNPLLIDISKYLSPGKNMIEIRRTGDTTQATAQIVETHYENWSANSAREQSKALRFAVNFDKTQAKIGEEILCKVEAERIGFHGYGMIMAEIGLPPGADVDRASLELAIQKSNWQINQYDILPDRVLVYLWPYAGGLQFEFKFRQRFAIEAKTASSVLYDYYNPEAKRVIAPVKFAVE
jgi:uncharacterized protein YfaS (alpha-2-macroglobulin family)